MNYAKFITTITVFDPEANGDVLLSVYKHDNGALFAIDGSYLEQNFDECDYPVIPDFFDVDSYGNVMQDLTLHGD